MGYLSTNLPFGRNIAECPEFYIYAMYVYFKRRDKFSADSPVTILSKTILDVLPDVEDWQPSVIRRDHVVFRFHDPAQRQLAFNALMASTPVELAIERATFSQVGSTVLPSGQVFPAPVAPPPPFPDLGPIITNLETQVNQLNIEVAALQAQKMTWLTPVNSFADLPLANILIGSVALTLDTGFTWQFSASHDWIPFLGSGGASSSSGIVVRPFAPGIVARDSVYQKSDGTVAPTSAIGELYMPCIGFVLAVNTPATGFCEVQQSGDMAGFSGLTPGRIYICSKNLGTIIWESDIGNPDYPGSNELGTVVQAVAIAADAATINIKIEQQEVN